MGLILHRDYLSKPLRVPVQKCMLLKAKFKFKFGRLSGWWVLWRWNYRQPPLQLLALLELELCNNLVNIYIFQIQPLLTSRWWITLTLLGVVLTSIPGVNSHDLLVVSLIRFVDAGEVLTGSPDLGDGDGRDDHEQHDSWSDHGQTETIYCNKFL